MPELGFRWRLAVSDPLPRGSRFAFVSALLHHVFCLRTGAPGLRLSRLCCVTFFVYVLGLSSSPLGVPKVPLRHDDDDDDDDDDDVPLAAVLLCPLCHCLFGIRGPLHMGGRRHGR